MMTSAQGMLPGWVEDAFDASRLETTRTSGSTLKQQVARRHGSIELSHVAHEFLAYWHSVRRAGALMPRAEDISPADFADLVPYVRYLSWEAGGALVYRVFGSALVAAIGADLTGIDVLTLSVPDERAADTKRMRTLHAHPCGSVVVRRMCGMDGAEMLIEMMNLPVAPGEDGKARIIGTVMACDPPSCWDFDFDQDSKVRKIGGSYIDVGFGVPDFAV